MKKFFLGAALVAAVALGANANDYKHVSPISIQLVEFNLDTMRVACGDNLDLYLTQLTSLQNDVVKEGRDIAEAQKNLKSEKKLYDTQMSFMKSRQTQVKNEKKFYQSEVKNYDNQMKNIKKQYQTLQKMTDISSPALQEQLTMLNEAEKDCAEGKARAAEIVKEITNHDEKIIDHVYEVLGQYLIEINDKTTRLSNLAAQNKTNQGVVKAQIKNVQAQIKAAK